MRMHVEQNIVQTFRRSLWRLALTGVAKRVCVYCSDNYVGDINARRLRATCWQYFRRDFGACVLRLTVNAEKYAYTYAYCCRRACSRAAIAAAAAAAAVGVTHESEKKQQLVGMCN